MLHDFCVQGKKLNYFILTAAVFLFANHIRYIVVVISKTAVYL